LISNRIHERFVLRFNLTQRELRVSREKPQLGWIGYELLSFGLSLRSRVDDWNDDGALKSAAAPFDLVCGEFQLLASLENLELDGLRKAAAFKRELDDKLASGIGERSCQRRA
jgi:hypothetical protein